MASQPPPDNSQYGDAEVTESTGTSEQTPFISEPPSRLNGSRSSRRRRVLRERASSITSLLSTSVPRARKPGAVITILCVIILVSSASGGFQNMSITRIFEDILCREYYGQIQIHDEPISEEMCKVDAIQSKLAYLFAIQSSLNAGVSVLAALPWGIAADKIGRRPVFAMGLLGMALGLLWTMIVGWFYRTLPPRLVWLSPIAYLLGGGNPVLAATLTSMAVDVVSESQRATSFMRIHGSSMVGNLISPALASIMMAKTGPWPPVFVAFLLTALPAFAIFLVPESLKPESADSEEPGNNNNNNSNNTNNTAFKARLKQSLHELKNSAKVFGSPSMILILLITTLQLSLVLCTYQFLSQFVSKRYGIPLADTGYVQSAYGIAFITVSFVIMPFLSSALLKFSTPFPSSIPIPIPSCFRLFEDDRRRDLFFARSSYLASMMATLVLGLAGSLPWFVLGLVILAFGVSGEGFLKSVATLHVSAARRTRLFTILGLAAIASDLWVSPSLAALFSLGMRLGGVWIGLPYLGVSVLCVLMFIMALFLKLPQQQAKGDEEEEGEEGSRLRASLDT